MKQAVRQRCGFGCVKCGDPIVTYDHMTPESVGGSTEADNLTCLCASHHDQKTRGIVSEKAVRQWNQDPYGLKEIPPTRVMEAAQVFGIALGSTLFRASGSIIRVVTFDGHCPIWLRRTGKEVEINAHFSDKDGLPLLEIRHSEIIVARRPWDLQWEANRLTLRSEDRVLLKATFDPEGIVHVSHGLIMAGDWILHVDGERIILWRGDDPLAVWERSAFNPHDAVDTILAIGWTPPGQRFALRIPG
jgi:hypothetical protein